MRASDRARLGKSESRRRRRMRQLDELLMPLSAAWWVLGAGVGIAFILHTFLELCQLRGE